MHFDLVTAVTAWLNDPVRGWSAPWTASLAEVAVKPDLDHASGLRVTVSPAPTGWSARLSDQDSLEQTVSFDVCVSTALADCLPKGVWDLIALAEALVAGLTNQRFTVGTLTADVEEFEALATYDATLLQQDRGESDDGETVVTRIAGSFLSLVRFSVIVRE